MSRIWPSRRTAAAKAVRSEPEPRDTTQNRRFMRPIQIMRGCTKSRGECADSRAGKQAETVALSGLAERFRNRPSILRTLIKQVVMSPTPANAGRPAYDSRRLKRIFDRRAATFDDVAFLPREIAVRVRAGGCGMGADMPGLRERFAEASVLGADLSAAMLARANQAEMAESKA